MTGYYHKMISLGYWDKVNCFIKFSIICKIIVSEKSRIIEKNISVYFFICPKECILYDI